MKRRLERPPRIGGYDERRCRCRTGSVAYGCRSRHVCGGSDTRSFGPLRNEPGTNIGFVLAGADRRLAFRCGVRLRLPNHRLRGFGVCPDADGYSRTYRILADRAGPFVLPGSHQARCNPDGCRGCADAVGSCRAGPNAGRRCDQDGDATAERPWPGFRQARHSCRLLHAGVHGMVAGLSVDQRRNRCAHGAVPTRQGTRSRPQRRIEPTAFAAGFAFPVQRPEHRGDGDFGITRYRARDDKARGGLFALLSRSS